MTDVTGLNKAATYTFSAANQTSDAVYPRGRTDMRITGTFTATVVIQEQWPAGTWTDIPGESYTAATAKIIDQAVPRPLRAKCSAYTSGSPVILLAADGAGAR